MSEGDREVYYAIEETSLESRVDTKRKHQPQDSLKNSQQNDKGEGADSEIYGTKGGSRL